MSKQVIIAQSEADINAINDKLGEMMGYPTESRYPDGRLGVPITYWHVPRQIQYGPKAGEWYIYDIKPDTPLTNGQKAEFTRWLNQNIQGYAREVFDPNWIDE